MHYRTDFTGNTTEQSELQLEDIKRKISRTVLDIISKRATPKEWANYATVPTSIKLYNQNNTRLSEVMVTSMIGSQEEQHSQIMQKGSLAATTSRTG